MQRVTAYYRFDCICFFSNVSYNFNEIGTYYKNMDYDHCHSALGIIEKKHT